MPYTPASPSRAQVRPSAQRVWAASAVKLPTAMQAVLTVPFLVLSLSARAESASQEPGHGLSGSIGMGVASVPTYEGSPNRRTVVGPALTLSYRSSEWGTVEWGPRGLIWNAVESGRFRFALVAQFDPGRKAKDNSRLNPTPGDNRLAGMGNVQSSTEVGVGVGYGPVMVVARQSLSERGAKGAQVDMTVEHSWSLSDRLGLHVAVGATWANQDYMQTYFGVTAAQAQATSFSVYTPKSGCHKVDLSVGAEYALAPNWKLQANVGFSRLGEHAAASPIVGRRNAASAALGVAYAF